MVTRKKMFQYHREVLVDWRSSAVILVTVGASGLGRLSETRFVPLWRGWLRMRRCKLLCVNSCDWLLQGTCSNGRIVPTHPIWVGDGCFVDRHVAGAPNGMWSCVIWMLLSKIVHAYAAKCGSACSVSLAMLVPSGVQNVLCFFVFMCFFWDLYLWTALQEL